jgi:hypothetical protein
MTIRAIPYHVPTLINLGAEALSGAQALAATLGIAQNTAPRISTDLYDYVGDPGETTNHGKQAVLNLKRDAETAARENRQATRQAGREFCSKAVDLLKVHLGRTWNPAWVAAGFSRFSIAVSKANVLVTVLEIRNYLREVPTRESVPLGITATLADGHATALQTAEAALNAAIAARKLASEQRDAAVKTLRRRLMSLREELELLLSPTDARWYSFGFSRPVDTRMPAAVKGLVLTPAGAGKVLVEHEASARAIDYRVSWKPQDGSGDPTVVGLFADLAVTLNGLPTGLTVVVSVTARNSAGETQPTEATIVVP